jgi:hypothetical protein
MKRTGLGLRVGVGVAREARSDCEREPANIAAY